MEKLIRKLKRYNKKAQKHRASYIKWLDKERRVAWFLQSTYYSDESAHNVALEILHEYGLSKEVLEEDKNEHDTKTG